MASVNVVLDYFGHWKTLLLRKLLGSGAAELPIRLWAYCGKYHVETAEVIGPAAEILEDRLEWWGEPGKAIEALLRVGFLEEIEGGYRVHNWTKYQGHLHAYKLRGEKGRASQLEKASRRPDAGNKPSSSQQQASFKPATSGAEAGSYITLQGITMQGGQEDKNTPPTFSPVNLAELFIRTQKPRCECKKCNLDFVAGWIQEMIRVGIKPETIHAEILREDRLKAEQFFKMTDRLEPKKVNGKVNAAEFDRLRTEKITQAAALRREVDREEKQNASPLTMGDYRKVIEKSGKEKNGHKDDTG